MDKLISLQAAIDAVCRACANGDDYVDCVERRPESTFCDEIVALRKLPSAQPERKKGHWIDTGEAIDNDTEVRCSECGEVLYWLSNFCPNCGAAMRDN